MGRCATMFGYSSALVALVASLLSVQAALPAGWVSQGCWLDNPGTRTLDAAMFFDPAFNTQEACVKFCNFRNYTFAGVEFGRECYCDSSINNGATLQNLSDCSIPCAGNSAEACGGVSRITLFQNTAGHT